MSPRLLAPAMAGFSSRVEGLEAPKSSWSERGTTTGTTRVRRRYDANSVGTGTTGTTLYMGVVPSRVVVVLFAGTTRYDAPAGCPVPALRCSSSVPRTALGTTVRRTPS